MREVVSIITGTRGKYFTDSSLFTELTGNFVRMKILLIEDETELVQVIKTSLEKEQFLVETAKDVETASEKIGLYEYDCILLDIMLPDGTGMEILQQLNSSGKPFNVIIISAKHSLDDKLQGLDKGADDYLTKPFHTAELNARVKALLRRKITGGKNSMEIANAVLNISDRTFSADGITFPPNRKEFDMLNYFFCNKNRLVLKTALAEHVWGDYIDQADNFDFIYYQMKNLRKKITASRAKIEIQSVYGVGYKLVEL